MNSIIVKYLEDDILLIIITSFIDYKRVSKLEEIIRENNKATGIIIELQNGGILGSPAIALIVRLQKYFNTVNKYLAIVYFDEINRELLEIFGIVEIFNFRQTAIDFIKGKIK